MEFINTISAAATNIYPLLIVLAQKIFGFILGLSIIMSILLLFGIIYCVERLKIIRNKEHDMYDVKADEGYDTAVAGDVTLAKRWDSVKSHIESTNPNDWRQAIMDADIILDDLLNKMEYHGESVGEKLKRVEKSDFNTLDEAWEAHKIRNQIAHEGSTTSLNQYEAKRVINLYKKVFEEFYYI
ncbi:MAG: hypothetical protein WCO48_01035 [Candidatus Taylorbacteria bacterium]